MKNRTRTWVVLVSSLAMVVLGLTAPAAVAAGTGTITGTFTDSETHSGVPGVSLNIVDSNSNATLVSTQSDGTYTSPQLASGNYTISYAKDGYEGDIINGVVVADGQATTVNKAINPLHTVQGMVTGTDGNLVTSGLIVAMSNQGGGWHEDHANKAKPIDGTGHYSLLTAAGARRFCLEDSGFNVLSCHGGDTVDDATTVTVPVGGTFTLNLKLGNPPTQVKPPVVIKSFAIKHGPTISGVARVGRILTASAGSYAPSAVIHYQWLRRGRVISGATGRTRLLRKADKGKRISVKVTYSRSGYHTVQRTSPPTVKVKKRKHR